MLNDDGNPIRTNCESLGEAEIPDYDTRDALSFAYEAFGLLGALAQAIAKASPNPSPERTFAKVAISLASDSRIRTYRAARFEGGEGSIEGAAQ